MKIKSRTKVEAYIPTASMADIAFLLIVFFMVATTMQVDKTTVELPLTVEWTQIPKGAAFVAITDDEPPLVKFSSGEENSFAVGSVADLAPHVAGVTSKNMAHYFVIKADKDVKYEKIDEVIDVLRNAQALNVLYLSRPKGSGG